MTRPPESSAGSLDAARSLQSIKPIANWLSIALDSAYKTRWICKKKGDNKGVARADRNIARLRAKASLEGRD